MKKYRNKPCQIGAEKYRSQREAKRHQDLLVLVRAGHVLDLRREVAFELAPAVVLDGRRKPAVRYFADFVFRTPLGEQIVEDAKGVRTPVYRLKRHLMKTVHGIEIKEI